MARTSNRLRAVWREGREYQGKRGGIRKVLRLEGDDIVCEVVDPGDDLRVQAGDLLTTSHLAMKRWTANDDKTYMLRASSVGGE